jgi:hypothetical protein
LEVVKERGGLRATVPQQERGCRHDAGGRWKHVKHPGWIQWDEAAGGLLVAEIRTKVKDHEWQMMDAFIGYLDRHLCAST